jgi:hypothetical protein
MKKSPLQDQALHQVQEHPMQQLNGHNLILQVLHQVPFSPELDHQRFVQPVARCFRLQNLLRALHEVNFELQTTAHQRHGQSV